MKIVIHKVMEKFYHVLDLQLKIIFYPIIQHKKIFDLILFI